MLMNKVFKTFFNRYDTSGTYHNGFIQSIDLSSYTDLTMLNDLSTAIIDSFLYNELCNRVVLERWKKYLVWDDTLKRFNIKPEFYTDAVVAIYVYLAKQQKFFEILETDFRSLSAQETETVNFGARTTIKGIGERLTTNVFDNVVVELSKGTETESKGTHTDTLTKGTHTDTESKGAHSDTLTKGAHTDTETKGAHSDSESKGTYTDTENIGAQTNSNTKTDSIFPFDAVAFVNDTKSEESTTNGAQANSTIYGAQSNSKSFGAQQNSNVFGSQEDTNAYGAQQNSNIYGAQENTNVYGAQQNSKTYGKTTNETKMHTDTERHSATSDNESISAHIDTKTRTKVLVIAPEKYFEIQKELAEKNIYTLFSQAVDECFLNNCFDFSEHERWGCIV